MNDSHRRLRTARKISRAAPMWLVALTLAFCAECTADEAVGKDPAANGFAEPAPAASHVRTPDRHLTVTQRIDENVRRLARGLNLDPRQQENLRQILVEQHRQMMHLRMGGSAVPGDVTGTTLAIYAQTRARIRAMLNDEQKSKYSAEVPSDALAPAQADLQHWMELQESSRKQGDRAAQ